MRHTFESLSPAVSSSSTWAEVCRKVGVKPHTGAQSHIKRRAEKFEIDFSHFVGKYSTKGKRFPRAHSSTYLFNGSTIKSGKLRQLLTREGLKEERCERCGLTEWMGEPIPLELDHVNGVNNDNRFDNLRVLCCNCHALTPTYCGRNIGRVV